MLSGVYQLPFGKGRGPLAMIARDWQVSGIWSAQTGQPFTVTLNMDPNGFGATARPTVCATALYRPSERNVNRWFDSTAFVAPTCACFGNSGRGILAGPSFSNIDLGVSREFLFTERITLQFRGEAFNLFNHPNLGLPASAIGAAG